MDTIGIGLWAMNMGLAPTNPGDFVARVVCKLEEAREQGADLLLMPEYMSEAWLTWAPPSLPETHEIAWMAKEAKAILPRLRDAARATALALLAGTVPTRVADDTFRNRAHLFLPDGRTIIQDKLTLTPDERDPQAWTLEPGTSLVVGEWKGLRLAMVICLDVEQPSLAARLQALDLDLVLVPSDTGKLSGCSRVFACAKARAIELFTCVATVGGVGSVPLAPPRPNVSGAAVYLPCEEAFGFTGIHSELAPNDQSSGDGVLLVARHIPVAAVRAQRRSGGEVWTGPWGADDVSLEGSLFAEDPRGTLRAPRERPSLS